MKPVRILYAVLVLSMLALAAFLVRNEARAEVSSSAPAESVLAQLETPMHIEAVALEPEGTGRLAGYTLTAMQAWMPPPAKMAGKATHLAAIARDVAWTALEEERAWDKSDGAREALVLASIGWHEAMFRDYVDDGSCNRWAAECYAKAGMLNTRVLSKDAHELMQLGTCDGGIAASLWQLHFECGGVRLFITGAWQNMCSAPAHPDPFVVVTKEQALAERRTAARVALAMARQSIRAGAGLRNYVGGEGPERAGMAASRLDKALGWYAKHPLAP